MENDDLPQLSDGERVLVAAHDLLCAQVDGWASLKSVINDLQHLVRPAVAHRYEQGRASAEHRTALKGELAIAYGKRALVEDVLASAAGIGWEERADGRWLRMHQPR